MAEVVFRPTRPELCTIALALCSWLCASGCSAPVVARSLPSAVIDYRTEHLDAKEVERASGSEIASPEPEEKDNVAYRVGPGDSVLVAVYGHPELSIATYAGSLASGAGGRTSGLVVDNDGSIQFPLIGTVPVAGKSSSELRVFLEQELTRFIKDPKVTVQVISATSIRYYLLGQFSDPGLKVTDRPLRLLEAISLGGSVLLERSNLRGAYVARGKRRLPVNFRSLLRDGDLNQNLMLKTGDIIVVPDNVTQQAFVFGPVGAGSVRGGAVPFIDGHLTIVQALSQAGFGFRERFQARLAKTVVIRSEGDRGEYFVVDVSKIFKGKAAPFPLQPGDVVLVPPTGFTNFNLALEQILPTLQTVAGVLQPFVQIRFLQQSYQNNGNNNNGN
jgi:polysaccharide biosynthesis/export protein